MRHITFIIFASITYILIFISVSCRFSQLLLTKKIEILKLLIGYSRNCPPSSRYVCAIPILDEAISIIRHPCLFFLLPAERERLPSRRSNPLSCSQRRSYVQVRGGPPPPSPNFLRITEGKKITRLRRCCRQFSRIITRSWYQKSLPNSLKL
jgi:hypothetical protein